VQGIPDRWFPERHFHEVMFGVWLAGCNHKSFGLKPSADRLLGVTMPTYKAVTEGRNFEDVDPDEAVIYGCADADCTRRLWLHPTVVAAVRRQREVYELERALIEPFRTMIRNGQYWDDAHLALVEAHLGAEVKRKNKLVTPATGIIGRISDQIRSMDGGATLNFDAPAQVASFFLGLRIALVEKTKGAKGQYATGEDVIAKYKCSHADDCAITLNTSLDCSCSHQCKWGKALVPRKKGDPKNAPPVFVEGWLCHPAIERMVMRRSLTNYARNYVLKLRAGIATYGPLLHFPFNQLGAPTGRMSAGGEKNADAAGVTAVQEQSMPDSKKAVYLPDIRAGLIANDPRLHIEDDDPEGFDIAAIDYSQIELRVAANLSKEPAWIEAFQKRIDIHLANARLAYKQPTMPRYIDDPANPGSEIENPKRGKGKTMGFAVLFGAADETVAAHGGIALDEASELLTNFWGGVAVLQRWVNQTHLNARCEKVVKTFLGRERPLHEWYTVESLTTRKMAWLARKGDREAVNTQIQGGAADIFKIAFVRVHRLIIERGWQDDCHIILPMHDELVFRVRRRLFDEIVPAIMACMATHGWPAPAGTFAIANWPVAITTDAERGPNWGKALKKYTPAVPTPRVCEACGTPSTYALCTVCQRVENRVGGIQDVQRRVPLFKVDAGPDPRLEARTRVRPVH
jgi:DNA polymerase I-like protein with 3'-5' exonuclease and polymerase domains